MLNMQFTKMSQLAAGLGIALLGSAAYATLVVPPQTGYWGAYNNLVTSLGESPLVLGVTPDTKSDDPGPAGEQGNAALVVHVRPEHRDLVAGVLSDHFLVKKDYNDTAGYLSVPLRVETAELARYDGTLHAIPWIQGENFPLAAHDFEFIDDSGKATPLANCLFMRRWPAATNPGLGQEARTPASILAAKVQESDTVNPHNPAREPVAKRRAVFLTKAVTPRGTEPQYVVQEPADGVELVRAVAGGSFGVYFVTPDYRAGSPANQVLVSIGNWEPKPLQELLRPKVTYKGTTYTVVTRVLEIRDKAKGKLRRKGSEFMLQTATGGIKAVVSAHWDKALIEQYVTQGTQLEVEGYQEPVNGAPVFFIVQMNPVQGE
jgi:hypothetical protein